MLNRVRLPFYLSKPQFPAEEDVYLKGNGTRVVLKSVVNKLMDGKTDYMPSLLHERLVIALKHDEVNIESDKYTASVRQTGPYDINWPDFLDYPFGWGSFKALEEAFVARSNRCDICEESNFLTLVDDNAGTRNEGDSFDIDVAANDSICCSDPVFSIFSYDTDYVDSISITQAGVVSVTLKTPLASAPDKLLFTYKVTCGSLEEIADVIVTVDGSLTPLCEAPTGLILSLIDPASLPEEIHAEWTAPGSPPADGYQWYLLDTETELTIASGTTASTSVNINALDCGKNYQFFVRAVCDLATDYFSAYIGDDITTPDCVVAKNMFLVNESGGAVQVDVDGINWNFAAAVNGNVEIFNSAVFTNESGLTLKFRFLQSMPSTLIIEQILANGGTYNFPADVSTYNYVRVSIP